MNKFLHQTEMDITKNTKPQQLDDFFLQHFDYCTARLCNEFSSGKYYCSEADAKDIFMDCILKVWEKMQNDSFEQDNIRGYLVTACRNNWIKKVQRSKTHLPFDVEKMEYHLGEQAGLYDEDFNPLVKAEIQAATTDEEKTRIEALQKAWKQLPPKAQQLLEDFYLKGEKLKDLQKKYGYSSYDTIKSMRRKFFNKLKKLVKEL